MNIGPYSVESIVEGRFALDGGAMFGIVPSPLWRRTNAPDDRNRIDLAARCLLLRGNDRCILVETGIGNKFDDKRADIFKVTHPGGGLLGELEARGVAAEQVTDVILTHLHFDHCGGTTRRHDGELRLTFPGATHYVQRRQWEWAQRPSDKDSGSYRGEDFELLAGAALHVLDGEGPILDGIDVHPVDGHTPGMQLVSLRDEDTWLLFCADLVPTRAHLRWPYIMAYDNQPLTTLEEKQRWLPQVAERGGVVVFGHDPVCDAARLRLENGGIAIEEELTL